MIYECYFIRILSDYQYIRHENIGIPYLPPPAELILAAIEFPVNFPQLGSRILYDPSQLVSNEILQNRRGKGPKRKIKRKKSIPKRG